MFYVCIYTYREKEREWLSEREIGKGMTDKVERRGGDAVWSVIRDSCHVARRRGKFCLQQRRNRPKTSARLYTLHAHTNIFYIYINVPILYYTLLYAVFMLDTYVRWACIKVLFYTILFSGELPRKMYIFGYRDRRRFPSIYKFIEPYLHAKLVGDKRTCARRIPGFKCESPKNQSFSFILLNVIY